jgi:type 1 fimbria pilin
LACPAGNPAKLFMTLTDATKPENRTSNLSLASTSTAKGVAVRIVEDGKSLSYGPDNAVVRNPNQFALATLGDGGQIFAVPMTAAYVSTGLVMPGSVQAVAIFTMSYQ